MCVVNLSTLELHDRKRAKVDVDLMLVNLTSYRLVASIWCLRASHTSSALLTVLLPEESIGPHGVGITGSCDVSIIGVLK